MASNLKPPLISGCRNVHTCPHEQSAWNAHHLLVWTTTGTGRKLVGGSGDVGSNDCEISVREFKYVWTPMPTGAGKRSSRKVQSKSSNKHAQVMTKVIYAVKLKMTKVI